MEVKKSKVKYRIKPRRPIGGKTPKMGMKKVKLPGTKADVISRKHPRRSYLGMNKRGNVLINVLMAVMAVIILIGVVPGIQEVVGISRNADGLNCKGYVDPTIETTVTGNLSYNANFDTNTFGCTILDLAIPFLVIGIIIASIILVMYGQRREQQPMEMYGGYGGGY